MSATPSPIATEPWATAASLVPGPPGLEVAHCRGAGHPKHIPLTPLPQLLTKPPVATQLIIACHPAMGDLITPRVEHLHTLLVSRVIPHRLGDMAFLASLFIPSPLLRQGQTTVEQDVSLTRHVSHKDAALALSTSRKDRTQQV
jgi:hypothetical protein